MNIFDLFIKITNITTRMITENNINNCKGVFDLLLEFEEIFPMLENNPIPLIDENDVDDVELQEIGVRFNKAINGVNGSLKEVVDVLRALASYNKRFYN